MTACGTTFLRPGLRAQGWVEDTGKRVGGLRVPGGSRARRLLLDPSRGQTLRFPRGQPNDPRRPIADHAQENHGARHLNRRSRAAGRGWAAAANPERRGSFAVLPVGEKRTCAGPDRTPGANRPRRSRTSVAVEPDPNGTTGVRRAPTHTVIPPSQDPHGGGRPRCRWRPCSDEFLKPRRIPEDAGVPRKAGAPSWSRRESSASSGVTPLPSPMTEGGDFAK